MANNKISPAQVLTFPRPNNRSSKSRKSGVNRNRGGSVRNINGNVYVDFIYLGERVRESSGLDWNDKNARLVRGQLDKIIVAIKSGTFKYAEVFPDSQRRDYFSQKERDLLGLQPTPDQGQCRDYFNQWYELLKHSGRVTERTLLGYKGYLNLYLQPFFGGMRFGQLNATTFERFISWARQQCYRGQPLANETLNKCFTVLKMICKSVAIEYGWSSGFAPFYGFRKLPEGDAYERIMPFTLSDNINCFPF